ncbi:hypothetical protein ABR738_05115 [Streptomyces sp. Edi4]|uniref:hypothetical protein n=1 Tax=Streptomyces sp. Edi4 TaxID=3162527 RepID=UPI003305E570
MHDDKQGPTLDVMTFRLRYPGYDRAQHQLAYLPGRPEHVPVLTGAANTGGTDFMARQFFAALCRSLPLSAAGYSVTFPTIEGYRETGATVVSRLVTRPLDTGGHVPAAPSGRRERGHGRRLGRHHRTRGAVAERDKEQEGNQAPLP